MAFKPLVIGITVNDADLDELITKVKGLGGLITPEIESIETALKDIASSAQTSMEGLNKSSKTAFDKLDTRINASAANAKKLFEEIKTGFNLPAPGDDKKKPDGGGGGGGGKVARGAFSLDEVVKFSQMHGTQEQLFKVKSEALQISKIFGVDVATAFSKVNAVAGNSSQQFLKLTGMLRQAATQGKVTERDFNRLTSTLQRLEATAHKANTRKNLAGGTGKVGAGLGVFASGLNAFGAGGFVGRAAGTLSLGTALGGFGGLGGVATGGILALAVGIGEVQKAFTQALETSFELENRLVRLRRASGDLTPSIDGLKERTFSLSVAMGSVPVTEVVHGVEELVKAGVDMDTAFGAAGRATLMFSRVAELSAGQATEFLVQTKNQLGIGFSEAADLIVAAADASTASIQEMAEAFTAGAFPAMSVGFSKEEFGALMAVVANMGLTGKEAATSLQRLGVRLGDLQAGLRVTAADMQVMRDIGIMEEFRALQAAPTGEGLIEFLKVAVASAESISQLSSLFDIFGQKTASRLKTAFELEPGKDKTQFQEALDAMERAAGVNALAFLDLQDTARTAFDEIGIAWDYAIRGLGDNNLFKSVARNFGDFINSLTGTVRSGVRDINLAFSGIMGDIDPVMEGMKALVAERMDKTVEQVEALTPIMRVQDMMNQNDELIKLMQGYNDAGGGVMPYGADVNVLSKSIAYGGSLTNDQVGTANSIGKQVADSAEVLDKIVNSKNIIELERIFNADHMGQMMKAMMSMSVHQILNAETEAQKQALIEMMKTNTANAQESIRAYAGENMGRFRDKSVEETNLLIENMGKLDNVILKMVEVQQKSLEELETQTSLEKQAQLSELMKSRGINQGGALQYAGMSIDEIRKSGQGLLAARNQADLLKLQNINDKPGPNMHGQSPSNNVVHNYITVEVGNVNSEIDMHEMASSVAEKVARATEGTFHSDAIASTPFPESVER